MTNNSFKITLVHVSDIHWRWDAAVFSEEKVMADDPKADVLPRHKAYLFELHKEIQNAAESANKIFLVLGGDHVFGSNYKVSNVDSLFEQLLLPTINLTNKSGKNVFDGVIAVPGNHDIFDRNRQSKKSGNAAEIGDPILNGSDKFCRFKAWCDYLRERVSADMKLFSPFDEPQFRIQIGEGQTVLFWAINSSVRCGSLDTAETEVRKLRDDIAAQIQKFRSSAVHEQLVDELSAFLPAEADKGKRQSYDPGYVNPMDMNACGEFFKGTEDLLRVAILHHNNLPTHNDDALKYRFLNASAFNNFLLRERFRLVLHGHQHIGEIAAYSKIESAEVDEQYSSYLVDGFLAVGAPAFDIGREHSMHAGFNVVSIEISPDHDICRVQVDKNICNEHGSFKKHTTRSDIALRRVSDGERLKCLRDVNRIVFSKTSIRGIARGLDSHDYRQNHAETLRVKLRSAENLRAIYALSVFPPSYWVSSKIMNFLLPIGRRNIQRASVIRRSSGKAAKGSSSLVFRFSHPLFHAIKTATANALCVNSYRPEALAKNFKKCSYVQAHDFVTSRIDAFGKKVPQMSLFGQAVTPGYKCQMAVHANSVRPYAFFSGRRRKPTKSVQELFEFPRIVLWEPEEFVRPSTLDMIEFHENLGFPLFWIDPELLRTRDGVVRKKLGYVSISEYDPTDREEQSVSEHMHEPNGTNVTHESLTLSAWGQPDAKLWPLDKKSMSLEDDRFNILRKQDKALHEFIWLLGHPSICFAADAWAAAYLSQSVFSNFRAALATKFDAAIQ